MLERRHGRLGRRAARAGRDRRARAPRGRRAGSASRDAAARARRAPRGRPATCRSSEPPATTPPRPWRPCRARGTSRTSRAAPGRSPGVEHDERVLDRGAMQAGFTNELGVAGRVAVPAQPHGPVALGAGVARVAGARRAADRRRRARGRRARGSRDIADRRRRPRVHRGRRHPRPYRGSLPARRSGRAARRLGQFTRCILQSLAVAYGETIARCVELTGRPVEVVHMVGGGSRSELLCRLTAEACERPVLAGPAEATSIGNLLVQAIATGELGSLDELRDVVRRSERRRPLRAGGQPCPLSSTRSWRSRGRSAILPSISRSWARATRRCAPARGRCWSRPAGRRWRP